MIFKNLLLVFDKTFSNSKISYVTIVDLAKMISKYEDEKKVYAHIKCFKYGDTGLLNL